MGMRTHIVGIVKPDKAYKEKIAAYRACEAAGVAAPKKLIEYFGEEGPDDRGLHREVDFTLWCADMQEGLEVDISKLPKDVHVLRFYNSW